MQIRVLPSEEKNVFYVEFITPQDSAEWLRLTAPWEGEEESEGETAAPARPRSPTTIRAASRHWQPWEELPEGWQEIRAVFNRELTVYEVLRVAGALGYALREHLAGDELSLPRVAVPTEEGTTVLEFEYDSSKSRRSERHDADAFDAATEYIVEGSPIRQTNRRGPGTQGTRLVEGIGPVKVQFFVR